MRVRLGAGRRPAAGPDRLLPLNVLRKEKAMLILTRRCAESLIIGDGEITVTVLGVKGNPGTYRR